MRALIAAFLALWLAAAPAWAQGVQCAPAEPAAASLREAGFELEITGLDTAGTVMELWIKSDGSWALVIRPSDALNVRCGIAAGNALTAIPAGSRTQGTNPAPLSPVPPPSAPAAPRAEPI